MTGDEVGRWLYFRSVRQAVLDAKDRKDGGLTVAGNTGADLVLV